MSAVPARSGEARQRRRRTLLRIRAVLAGGLVLGIGAAVTLASWNDGENATAQFTAGRFGIEGSLTGNSTDYGKHGSGSPAALSFSAPSSGMYPGAVVYAAFAVRTTAGSSAGTVKLTAPSAPTGTLTELTYGVRLVATVADCSSTGYAAAVGAIVVNDGTSLATGAAGSQALGANGAGGLVYCFALALPVGASAGMQGQTLTQTWQFAATSS